MKGMKFLFVVPSVVLALFTFSAAETAPTVAPHYRVQVRVEPESHTIEAEVHIQHPPSSQFTLNKDFSIREIKVDGKQVTFHRDAGKSSVALDATPGRDLQITYSGQIKDVVSGVNLIGPALVELALYSAWYPRFKGAANFTFDLEANLPDGFPAVTNGRQNGQQKRAGRSLTKWTSYGPGFDLVLLASPELHKVAADSHGTRVEMYYSQLPPELLKSKIEALIKGMERLSSIYGPPTVRGVLRFAYSPRSGWGYSRIPLFVVSEQYAVQRLKEADGQAWDFLDNCHEMAHFWWNIVDMGTPNDWINEGLAEYSAFRLAEERFGTAFRERRIAEYSKHASESKTLSAIAETENASPDRYVNRYEKTTLMFLEAQHRFGQEALDRCLREFYARYAGTHQATTELFLQQVRNSMGTDVETYFREELYRRPHGKPGVNATAAN